jgi:hypothetical protein
MYLLKMSIEPDIDDKIVFAVLKGCQVVFELYNYIPIDIPKFKCVMYCVKSPFEGVIVLVSFIFSRLKISQIEISFRQYPHANLCRYKKICVVFIQFACYPIILL